MGLSTEIVKGTVLPFSAISGMSMVSLPSAGLASPMIFLTACSQSSLSQGPGAQGASQRRRYSGRSRRGQIPVD